MKDSLHLVNSVYSDPVILSTVVIACATVANVFVSTLMWLITRRYVKITEQIFNAQQRPFIGVASYTFESDPQTKRISLGVKFENFGTIPARKFDANWEVYIGEMAIQINKTKVNPSTLFPKVPSIINGSMIQEKTYDSIMNGAVALEIIFKATYQGVTDIEYETYEKARFVARLSGFVAIDGNWK
jgi:hypothetical protein